MLTIEAKLSFDAEADGHLKSLRLESLEYFRQKAMKEASLYYFTFLDDDYEKKWIRIVVTDRMCSRFLVTMPKEKVVEAILWLRQLNGHLNFSAVEVNFQGNDFERDNISAMLSFKP